MGRYRQRSRDLAPYLPLFPDIPGCRRISPTIPVDPGILPAMGRCRQGSRGSCAPISRYFRISRDIAGYLPLFPSIPRSCQLSPAIPPYLQILGGYGEISPDIPGSCAVSPAISGYLGMLPYISSYFQRSWDLASYLQLFRRISRSWRLWGDIASDPGILRPIPRYRGIARPSVPDRGLPCPFV
jgi:hypothetical protein